MTQMKPEDSRDRWEVFSNTKPYQSMTESQRMIFDHAEENGMRGAKRYTRDDIAKWKEKRANMTAEELAEMEMKLEEKGRKGGIALIIGIAIFFSIGVIGCMMAAG